MAPYIYKPYPAFRYHRDFPARIVLNEDADRALGAGWAPHRSDTRAPRFERPEAEPAAADVKVDEAVHELGSHVPAAGSPDDEPFNLPGADELGDVLPTAEEIATGLFSTTSPSIIASIKTAENVAILERTREVERVNPKGARKGIIDALDARIAKLTA